jgi:arylsulfatase A-like enzyme/lipopolysaccharide biosynthesis regulator YciM
VSGKLWFFLSFLLLLCLISCGYFSDLKTAEKVIFITLDTTRADRLGCYGYQKVETPHIDRIASKGILFKNAVSHVPTTLPSHSSMMTGLYPIKHGVRSNHIYRLLETNKTLAEILKENGYETGAVISALPLAKRFGIAQGFDYFEESFLEEFMGVPELIKERGAKDSIDVALKWLEDKKDEKFFLWLHLYDPHTPYNPPAPFHEKYKDHLYDGEIAYMDDALGGFFGQLEEWGLFENSFILILGDHGEGLGDHGEYGHQFLIYESNVRVPLIIHYPQMKKNSIVDDTVAAVDAFQTILDACHIKEEYKNDGRSLIPYIKNPARQGERCSYYIESLSGEISFGWSPLYGLRNNEWKYIEAPEEELYNLSEDPDERNNLARQETEVAEEMSESLQKILIEFAEAGQELASEQSMSPEEQMKLASLGYVGVARSQMNPDRSYKNPKDLIFLERDALKAFQLLMHDRFNDALPFFRRIIDADPENKSALLYIGESYFKRGEWKKAERYFEKFVSLFPDLLQGYEKLAKIYSHQKAWNKLNDLTLKSLSYIKEDFKTQNIFFSSIVKNAGCDRSINIFEEAVGVDEEMPSLYFFLSKCYAIKGEKENALKYLKWTLEKDAKNVFIGFAMYDAAFQNIRDRQDFKELISKYRISEKKNDEKEK